MGTESVLVCSPSILSLLPLPSSRDSHGQYDRLKGRPQLASSCKGTKALTKGKLSLGEVFNFLVLHRRMDHLSSGNAVRGL
eukprot:scaffold2861_cov386-Pavlova_lutheri.AAC.2